MTLATKFHAAFLNAFEQMRRRFDDRKWESKWKTKDFSQLMIYDPQPG